MNCCDTTAKILLVVFNAIFLVCGLAILVVGIWIKADPDFSNFGNAIKVSTDEPIVEIVTWTFIGIGIFVFAIAFAGLIGTIRESKIIMGFYIVCVFIVFAAEASAGIYAGIRKDYLINTIKKEASERLKTTYSDDKESFLSQGFNYVQTKWSCCGVNDFMDYKNSTYIKNLKNKIKVNATLSWACCKSDTSLEQALQSNGQLIINADNRTECMQESITVTKLYAKSRETALETCKTHKTFVCYQGCEQALTDWSKEHMVILLGVGVGVGALQLLIMFLALWFCQSLGKYVEKDEDKQ